jgi:hypothetical protein
MPYRAEYGKAFIKKLISARVFSASAAAGSASGARQGETTLAPQAPDQNRMAAVLIRKVYGRGPGREFPRARLGAES